MGSMPSKAVKQFGPTPLMLAAKSGSVGAVLLLLENRANVSSWDEEKMRPLHWAALSGELQVAKVLMGAKAYAGARDIYDQLPLDHLPSEVRQDPAELRMWTTCLAVADRAAKDDHPNGATLWPPTQLGKLSRQLEEESQLVEGELAGSGLFGAVIAKRPDTPESEAA